MSVIINNQIVPCPLRKVVHRSSVMDHEYIIYETLECGHRMEVQGLNIANRRRCETCGIEAFNRIPVLNVKACER